MNPFFMECVCLACDVMHFLTGDKAIARKQARIIPTTIKEAPTYPTGYRVSFVGR